MPTLEEIKKRKQYITYANQTEEKYGLPKNLLVGVMGAESNFNPNAVSHVGAKGLMQFMKATAQEYGINPLNPSESINAAGKYLQSSYKKFGNWEDALRSYNMGVGGLQKVKAGKKSLPKETKDYVGRVYKYAGIKYEDPSYVNTSPQDNNQVQETITPTLNYFNIPKEITTFASVPDSAKEDKKETVEDGVTSKDVAEVEQKTKEYNFLEELQKEDYSHLQPEQVAQQQTVPQVDFMQQYEQVSQFIDQPLAQQGGLKGQVRYGTPEYREAYNKGEVITKKGERSPILLDEVVVKGKNKDKNWLEQYADKITEENKDSGILGAIIGTPISAVTSFPQMFATKAMSGEMQRPSEAIDIQNPYGAMAVDVVADPANLIGLGVLTKEKALAKLATSKESGLLSNTYKLNPLAEKLKNPNNSYRVAGIDSYEDFVKSGVLRSKTNLPENPTVLDRMNARPTAFPSFQKGFADINYLPENGGVIYETNLPTFRRGDINPVTNLPIKGRHYAHRVIDPNSGNAVSEIPSSSVKVFEGKPDWLKGFKEMQQGGSWQEKLANRPKKPTVAEIIAEGDARKAQQRAQTDNTKVSNYNDARLFNPNVRNKTDKEIAQEREAKIQASVEAQKTPYTRENWRQQLASETAATGDKLRVSLEPNFFDDYINPAVMIGGMASNLGQAPLQAKQSDSILPYVTAVGAPLAVGAMAGIGANSTGQFVNNLANPLAGTGDLVNNLGNKLDDKLTDLFYGKKGVSNSMKVIDRVEIKNIDKLKKRYKDEFESKYGNDYSDKDLELYVKLKKVEKGKLNDIDYNIDEMEDFIDRNDISREYSSKDKLLTDIYTKGYDSSLNRRVPEGITYNRGLYEDVIPQFEDLILKNKLKSKEVVYRGNDDFLIKDVWRNGEKLENLKFSDLQKGDEYMPNSFYSTSVDKNVATRFGEIASKIEAPKGQSVFVPNATKSGNFPTELEVVLPEKLRYKVDEVYEPEKLYGSVKDITDGQQLGDYIKKGESLYYKHNDKPVPDNLVKNILDRINFDTAKNNKIKYKQSIVNPYVFIPPIAGASYLATQGQNKQQGGKQNYTENELAFLSEIQGIPVSSRGMYDYPNQEVIVPTNGSITMKGIPHKIKAKSLETGEEKILKPNREYYFKNTKNVLEIPFFKK